MARSAQMAVPSKRHLAAGLRLAEQGRFAVAAEVLEAAANSGEPGAGILAAEAYLRAAFDQVAAMMRRSDRDSPRMRGSKGAQQLELCRQKVLRAASIAKELRKSESMRRIGKSRTLDWRAEDDKEDDLPRFCMSEFEIKDEDGEDDRLTQLEHGVANLLEFLPQRMGADLKASDIKLKMLICGPDAAIPRHYTRGNATKAPDVPSSSSESSDASDSAVELDRPTTSTSSLALSSWMLGRSEGLAEGTSSTGSCSTMFAGNATWPRKMQIEAWTEGTASVESCSAMLADTAAKKSKSGLTDGTASVESCSAMLADSAAKDGVGSSELCKAEGTSSSDPSKVCACGAPFLEKWRYCKRCGKTRPAAPKRKARTYPKSKAHEELLKAQVEADKARKERFTDRVSALRAQKEAEREKAAKAEEQREATIEAKRQAERQRVIELFQEWDHDKNGTIEEKELEEILKKSGLSDDNIRDLFVRIDLNSDGRVEYNEFVCWLFSEPCSPLKRSEVTRKTLRLERSPDVALFLLEDQQPGSIVKSETSFLVGSAVFHAVPGEDAKHPQRAEGAVLLLGCAYSWISPAREPSYLDVEVIKLLFFDSIPSAQVTIDRVELVVQRGLLKRFLAKVAEVRSSVEVTFHGTSESKVAPISAEGLSTKVHVEHGGLFGLGAYCGAHAGLAHKYTSPNSSGQRRMFCALVNLGKVIVGSRDKLHETTTTDHLWNPTQYCVCEEERVLVTHLITYRVTGRGTFAAHLRKAIERASSNAVRSGK